MRHSKLLSRCVPPSTVSAAYSRERQVLETGTKDCAVYEMKASALEKLGKPKAALQSIKLAIQLEPKRWELYAKAARLFIAVQNAPSALAMLQHAEKRFAELPLPTEPVAKKKQAAARQGLAQLRAQAAGGMTAGYRTCNIAKLPVEMLESVFALLILPEQRYAPILSHVCHFWRELCLAKPPFWHTLILDGTKRSLARLDTWLARADGRIRELQLLTGARDPFTFRSWLPQLQWHLLRKLHIASELPVWEQIKPFLAAVADGCPTGHLEDLSLEVATRASCGSIDVRPASPEVTDVDRDNADAEAMNTDGQQRNKLRSLTVRNGALASHDVVLSCRALTSFSLYGVRWLPLMAQFVRFLERNPGLETLVLEQADDVSAQGVEQEHVLLPALTHLSMSIKVGVPFAPLKLHAPNLVHLHIVSAPSFPGLESALQSLVNRGGLPALEELRIQRASRLSTSMEDLLALSPRLRALQFIEISTGVQQVLKWLSTPQEGGSLPCPRLKHANFSGCPDITTSPLVALVKGRLVPPDTDPERTPLATLVVDLCPLIEAETIPWFTQRVKTFSCRYMTKKQASHKR
jgi:F-box/TPR repeat protein Pof3